MNALQYVSQTLESIFHHPKMFGSSEAVEAQVLTLLEMRYLLMKNEDPKRVIIDAYNEFGRGVFGGLGCRPLGTVFLCVDDLAPHLERFAKLMENL